MMPRIHPPRTRHTTISPQPLFTVLCKTGLTLCAILALQNPYRTRIALPKLNQ
ncbi:hypothetical protein BDW02DRAFT_64613 [Decorospora gaudefroyi]|uniref:Uncharacterized protein n=1 Tax=Decorospora gaudefroyi TaxID=184978 RepID=A0A6A5K4V8_9PLEO|nr:hypothetical protein BDW02DRAFT_64613 [Decorospora gaudefroyi]